MFRDRVELGGLPIANVSMTLASGCNTGSGILSLGHAAAEPSGADFLTALVNQGLIATEAFSLWLSGWTGHTGRSGSSSLENCKVDSTKQTVEVFSLEPSTGTNTPVASKFLISSTRICHPKGL